MTETYEPCSYCGGGLFQRKIQVCPDCGGRDHTYLNQGSGLFANDAQFTCDDCGIQHRLGDLKRWVPTIAADPQAEPCFACGQSGLQTKAATEIEIIQGSDHWNADKNVGDYHNCPNCKGSGIAINGQENCMYCDGSGLFVRRSDEEHAKMWGDHLDEELKKQGAVAVAPVDDRPSESCFHCGGTGETSTGGTSRPCPSCEGTGGLKIDGTHECRVCEGTGKNVSLYRGTDCAACKGTGIRDRYVSPSGRSVVGSYDEWAQCRFCDGPQPDCRVCNGSGLVSDETMEKVWDDHTWHDERVDTCPMCNPTGWLDEMRKTSSSDDVEDLASEDPECANCGHAWGLHGGEEEQECTASFAPGVDDRDQGIAQQGFTPCVFCEGTGQFESAPCPYCRGSGMSVGCSCPGFSRDQKTSAKGLRQEVCPACEGDGRCRHFWPSHLESECRGPCRECVGSGLAYTKDLNDHEPWMIIDCEDCGGEGMDDSGNTCFQCGTTGQKTIRRRDAIELARQRGAGPIGEAEVRQRLGPDVSIKPLARTSAKERTPEEEAKRQDFIKSRGWIRCQYCGGTGRLGTARCVTCNSTGMITYKGLLDAVEKDGSSKTAEVLREPCPDCPSPGHPDWQCPTCWGSGLKPLATDMERFVCASCDGEGCHTCDDTGIMNRCPRCTNVVVHRGDHWVHDGSGFARSEVDNLCNTGSRFNPGKMATTAEVHRVRGDPSPVIRLDRDACPQCAGGVNMPSCTVCNASGIAPTCKSCGQVAWWDSNLGYFTHESDNDEFLCKNAKTAGDADEEHAEGWQELWDHMSENHNLKRTDLDLNHMDLGHFMQHRNDEDGKQALRVPHKHAGANKFPDRAWGTCPPCKGSGMLTDRTCHACDGSGIQLIPDPCVNCNHTGLNHDKFQNVCYTCQGNNEKCSGFAKQAKTRMIMPAKCPSCESSETRGRYTRGGWREYVCLDCGSEFKNRDSKVAANPRDYATCDLCGGEGEVAGCQECQEKCRGGICHCYYCDEDGEYDTCSWCKGSGLVENQNRFNGMPKDSKVASDDDSTDDDLVKCDNCKGTGEDPDLEVADGTPCAICRGTGIERFGKMAGNKSEFVECATCEGSGQVDADWEGKTKKACFRCSGSGLIGATKYSPCALCGHTYEDHNDSGCSGCYNEDETDVEAAYHKFGVKVASEQEECGTCAGTGQAPGAKGLMACFVCDGSGIAQTCSKCGEQVRQIVGHPERIVHVKSPTLRAEQCSPIRLADEPREIRRVAPDGTVYEFDRGQCSFCKGTGVHPGYSPLEKANGVPAYSCTVCKGTGIDEVNQRWIHPGTMDRYDPCPDCADKPITFASNGCPTCGGTQKVKKSGAKQGPKITFVQGDITQQDTDAIVNAANESLAPGGGVCGAIHRAAGPGLEKECEQITEGWTKKLAPGDAVITQGYHLPAKHVIHAVGPRYTEHKEPAAALHRAHTESLKRADEVGAKSVSFPAISTGIFGYPLEEASKVAVDAVRNADTNVEEVRFVSFDDKTHGEFSKHAGFAEDERKIIDHREHEDGTTYDQYESTYVSCSLCDGKGQMPYRGEDGDRKCVVCSGTGISKVPGGQSWTHKGDIGDGWNYQDYSLSEEPGKLKKRAAAQHIGWTSCPSCAGGRISPDIWQNGVVLDATGCGHCNGSGTIPFCKACGAELDHDVESGQKFLHVTQPHGVLRDSCIAIGAKTSADTCKRCNGKGLMAVCGSCDGLAYLMRSGTWVHDSSSARCNDLEFSDDPSSPDKPLTYRPCYLCEGTGNLKYAQAADSFDTCKDCKGTGMSWPWDCKTCKGSGLQRPGEDFGAQMESHQEKHGNWEFDASCAGCVTKAVLHKEGHPEIEFEEPRRPVLNRERWHENAKEQYLKRQGCYLCTQAYLKRKEDAPAWKRPFVSSAETGICDQCGGDGMGIRYSENGEPDYSSVGLVACDECDGSGLYQEATPARRIGHVGDDNASHHSNVDKLREEHPYWDPCPECEGDGVSIGSTNVETGEQKQSPCKNCAGLGEAYDAEYWESEDQLHDFANYPAFKEMCIPDKTMKTHLKDVHEQTEYDDTYSHHQTIHGINVDPEIAGILINKQKNAGYTPCKGCAGTGKNDDPERPWEDTCSFCKGSGLATTCEDCGGYLIEYGPTASGLTGEEYGHFPANPKCKRYSAKDDLSYRPCDYCDGDPDDRCGACAGSGLMSEPTPVDPARTGFFVRWKPGNAEWGVDRTGELTDPYATREEAESAMKSAVGKHSLEIHERPLGRGEDYFRLFPKQGAAVVCQMCGGQGFTEPERDFMGRCEDGKYEGNCYAHDDEDWLRENHRCRACRGSGIEVPPEDPDEKNYCTTCWARIQLWDLPCNAAHVPHTPRWTVRNSARNDADAPCTVCGKSGGVINWKYFMPENGDMPYETVMQSDQKFIDQTRQLPVHDGECFDKLDEEVVEHGFDRMDTKHEDTYDGSVELSNKYKTSHEDILDHVHDPENENPEYFLPESERDRSDVPAPPDVVDLTGQPEECPACVGSGLNDNGTKCAMCMGVGKYLPPMPPRESALDKGEVDYKQCAHCEGTGRHNDSFTSAPEDEMRCTYCHGTGVSARCPSCERTAVFESGQWWHYNSIGGEYGLIAECDEPPKTYSSTPSNLSFVTCEPCEGLGVYPDDAVIRSLRGEVCSRCDGAGMRPNCAKCGCSAMKSDGDWRHLVDETPLRRCGQGSKHDSSWHPESHPYLPPPTANEPNNEDEACFAGDGTIEGTCGREQNDPIHKTGSAGDTTYPFAETQTPNFNPQPRGPDPWQDHGDNGVPLHNPKLKHKLKREMITEEQFAGPTEVNYPGNGLMSEAAKLASDSEGVAQVAECGMCRGTGEDPSGGFYPHCTACRGTGIWYNCDQCGQLAGHAETGLWTTSETEPYCYHCNRSLAFPDKTEKKAAKGPVDVCHWCLGLGVKEDGRTCRECRGSGINSGCVNCGSQDIQDVSGRPDLYYCDSCDHEFTKNAKLPRPKVKWGPCDQCDGTGQCHGQDCIQGADAHPHTCADCKGTGIAMVCPDCGGTAVERDGESVTCRVCNWSDGPFLPKQAAVELREEETTGRCDSCGLTEVPVTDNSDDDTCDFCSGTGQASWNAPEGTRCPECKGSGIQLGGEKWQYCRKCRGISHSAYPQVAQCPDCGYEWDAHVEPTPSGRCPNEHNHHYASVKRAKEKDYYYEGDAPDQHAIAVDSRGEGKCRCGWSAPTHEKSTEWTSCKPCNSTGLVPKTPPKIKDKSGPATDVGFEACNGCGGAGIAKVPGKYISAGERVELAAQHIRDTNPPSEARKAMEDHFAESHGHQVGDREREPDDSVRGRHFAEYFINQGVLDKVHARLHERDKCTICKGSGKCTDDLRSTGKEFDALQEQYPGKTADELHAQLATHPLCKGTKVCYNCKGEGHTGIAAGHEHEGIKTASTPPPSPCYHCDATGQRGDRSCEHCKGSGLQTGKWAVTNIEDQDDGESALWWSNKHGWVGPDLADRFDDNEKMYGTVPHGGEWRLFHTWDDMPNHNPKQAAEYVPCPAHGKPVIEQHDTDAFPGGHGNPDRSYDPGAPDPAEAGWYPHDSIWHLKAGHGWTDDEAARLVHAYKGLGITEINAAHRMGHGHSPSMETNRCPLCGGSELIQKKGSAEPMMECEKCDGLGVPRLEGRNTCDWCGGSGMVSEAEVYACGDCGHDEHDHEDDANECLNDEDGGCPCVYWKNYHTEPRPSERGKTAAVFDSDYDDEGNWIGGNHKYEKAGSSSAWNPFHSPDMKGFEECGNCHGEGIDPTSVKDLVSREPSGKTCPYCEGSGLIAPLPDKCYVCDEPEAHDNHKEPFNPRISLPFTKENFPERFAQTWNQGSGESDRVPPNGGDIRRPYDPWPDKGDTGTLTIPAPKGDDIKKWKTVQRPKPSTEQTVHTPEDTMKMEQVVGANQTRPDGWTFEDGQWENQTYVKCSYCDGTGIPHSWDQHSKDRGFCFDCDGTGIMKHSATAAEAGEWESCHNCGGSGKFNAFCKTVFDAKPHKFKLDIYSIPSELRGNPKVLNDWTNDCEKCDYGIRDEVHDTKAVHCVTCSGSGIVSSIEKESAKRVTNLDKLKSWVDENFRDPNPCETCGEKHTLVSMSVEPDRMWPKYKVGDDGKREFDPDDEAYWVPKDKKKMLMYYPAGALHTWVSDKGPEIVHREGYEEHSAPFDLTVKWNPYVHQRDHATMVGLHEVGHVMQAMDDWEKFKTKSQSAWGGIHSDHDYEREAFTNGLKAAKGAGIRITRGMRDAWRDSVGGTDDD